MRKGMLVPLTACATACTLPDMARRPAPNALRAVAYLRVSTDEQALGPEAQRAAIEAWAARAGVAIVAWHLDQGVSGGAALDRRPALLAALDGLETTGAGLLVVAKRDRLARDVVLAAMIERLAARTGARVVSAAGEGSDDGDDPSALLMRRMVDAFAEYERALIRARTRAALAVKSARGERVGQVPFGFRVAADGVALERDEGEQAALATIRALRLDGLSFERIAAELNTRGVPARGARWHKTTVVRLAREAA